ncbi:26827_t:CDS:2 [Dentiscutata erythropus]|uniref:26827_t:CDS:1 n=1 Tax=Dentiscutata erythropus TaxID=1348616 RepID=A0A9N9IER1_9GLOM|nr:26827_t:CDS:2 [Dentiscutata erythropus]
MNVAMIPSRLISHLQPLDISLNKAFKAKIRHHYTYWINEAIKEYMSKTTIWIKEAWNDIDPAIIQYLFKYCRISTEINSFKDNSIFNFERVLDKKRKIGIVEIEKSDSEDVKDLEDNKNNKNDPEFCEYYKNEEGNYINIWN